MINKDNNKNKISVSTVNYEGLTRFQSSLEVFGWQRQVFKEDNSWNNDAVSDGMIVSPYLTLKINGADVPVYASRATFSTHSFAYAEVESEGDFSLCVELHLFQKRNAVVVLPESKGVKATVHGDFDVSAEIREEGSYSFAFEHYVEGAFTLFVRRKQPFAVPSGYRTQEILPARHTLSETCFDREKTVYRFKAGAHYLEAVTLPSDSILYFEDGAIVYAECNDENNKSAGIINSANTRNVTICGRGAIDYSAVPGGRKTGFEFVGCKNLTVKDLTLINSPGWTLCVTGCEEIRIGQLMFIAYRMFSDGIMLSDCKNALIENCFLRTGDDAAEVKSTSDLELRTDNILFRKIDVWMDKACGFGIVFECNHDSQNVRFEDCSVGFALPNWSKHLGCITVNTGNNSNAVDYDIFFKNIEIYYTLCSPVTICAYEGDIRDIYIENVKVKYNFSDVPVLAWIRDAEKASIGKLYLDDITVNNIRLTEKSERHLVGVDAPEGAFDRSNLIINSLR